MEDGQANRPYMGCDGCQGAGLVIGPWGPEAGGRPRAECQKCAGTGALILRGLRKGKPFYGQPKV